jgi:hypothetical protein
LLDPERFRSCLRDFLDTVAFVLCRESTSKK